MRFSVIVPAYNVENYLSECIESVLKQTNQDYEAILVDDGSTDKTGNLCDKYMDAYPEKIKVIHQENQGLSGARNSGIKAAQGEYIVLLDADDFLKEDALEILKGKICEQRPEVVVSSVIHYDSETQTSYTKNWTPLESWSTAGEVLENCSDLNSFTLGAWALTVQREFLLENELWFYPKLKHEDELWFPQVIIQGNNIVLNANPFYCYRLSRQGSIMQVPNIDKYFDRLFIVEQLEKVATQQSGKNKEAIELRCVKLLAGMILNNQQYKRDQRYPEFLKKLKRNLFLLKHTSKAKYKILYFLCVLFGSSAVSSAFLKIKSKV